MNLSQAKKITAVLLFTDDTQYSVECTVCNYKNMFQLIASTGNVLSTIPNDTHLHRGYDTPNPTLGIKVNMAQRYWMHKYGDIF